jgi:N-methylhydantoinase A
LFTFALQLEHELVSLRAAVQGKGISVKRPVVPKGSADPKAAVVGKQASYMDGKAVTATVYDRAKLKAGNKVKGPAIVMEMDSTSVILPKHYGLVDKVGCILIYPDGYKAASSNVKKRK